jgi:hypothetical protein
MFIPLLGSSAGPSPAGTAVGSGWVVEVSPGAALALSDAVGAVVAVAVGDVVGVVVAVGVGDGEVVAVGEAVGDGVAGATIASGALAHCWPIVFALAHA